MAKPNLLFPGLNPAWQKTLFFERFQYNDINRADKIEENPSGKGVNAARAARNDGATVTVAQFAGGDSGRKLLAGLAAEGIANITVHSAAETRTCTTILDAATNSMTELIEPSPIISAEESIRLAKKILPVISTFDGIAICGTFPPGVPESFYAEIIAAAKNKIPVVLDAFKEVNQALQSAPDMLKINQAELAELTRCGDDIRQGIQQLLDLYPIAAAAITTGPGSAFIGTIRGIRKINLPRLDHIISPLGAGDTVTAVFTTRLCRAIQNQRISFPFQVSENSFIDQIAGCFADGLAAASASCLTPYPALFDQKTARDIRQQITVRV